MLKFLDIRTWFSNVEQHATEGVNKILIGNKCDWEEKRAISVERGQELADELGIPFMEVSAKSNINVEKAFYSLAADIKKRIIDTSRADPGLSQSVNVGDQTWWFKHLYGGQMLLKPDFGILVLFAGVLTALLNTYRVCTVSSGACVL